MSSEPEEETGAETEPGNTEGAVARHNQDVIIQVDEGEKKATEDEEENDKEKNARKPMAPRSDIWDHFLKIKDDQGIVKKGKCNLWLHENNLLPCCVLIL